MTGVLNLDKPAGMSSARAVDAIKRLLPRGVKVGHAGTLDPFATGVLLVLIGGATRLCESLMDAPKQYEAVLKLGATTATDDPESPEQVTAEAPVISRSEIENMLPAFVGAIRQRPPSYSAIKVAGRRAYQLARKGQTVELDERIVQVHAINLLAYDWPALSLRIDCGRGTYIRALARDIGQALGCGAYLTQLRRTRVGDFYADSAIALTALSSASFPGVLATSSR